MCMPVVLDRSAFDVFGDDSPGSPGVQIRQWIRAGHGRVAYSNYGRLGSELEGHGPVSALVESYYLSGLAVPFDDKDIEEEENRLREYRTASGKDDRHMLALAAVSKAAVMVTRDKDLIADFKNDALVPATDPRQAVFPIRGSRKARQAFLDARRCPQRLK